MVRTLFFLGTALLALAKVGAAPPKRYYDQRQNGNFNADVKLENLLFVAVFPLIPINSGLIEPALSAIEHLDLSLFRSKGQDSIKGEETVHQDDSPAYAVEVVQINENRPDKESSVRKAEGDAETSSVSEQRPTPVGDGQTPEKEEAGRAARNVKNFDFPKSREVPSVPGYFVNVRKTSGRPKTGDGGRARNVVGNVWNPDDEPGRPGTSLKKQLPRRGEGDVAPPASNADKNDVSPALAEEEEEKQQQELSLLGDGVENCGPGRRRDASGVCESDGSADSL